MRKLHAEIQDSGLIRSGDMAYAGKTYIICRMISEHDQCFLTRPHFFGKSLLVSALESLFSKGREMFKGLAIEKLWTEMVCKMIRFSFAGCSDLRAGTEIVLSSEV